MPNRAEAALECVAVDLKDPRPRATEEDRLRALRICEDDRERRFCATDRECSLVCGSGALQDFERCRGIPSLRREECFGHQTSWYTATHFPLRVSAASTAVGIAVVPFFEPGSNGRNDGADSFGNFDG